MTIKTKVQMYLDLEDNTLNDYLDKLEYPWCHESIDYRTIPAGETLCGWTNSTEFSGYRYPAWIYNDEIIIYLDQLNDTRLYEVIKE